MISKEQAEILKKVKINDIPKENEYYNSNKILQELDNNEYIYMELNYENGDMNITDYKLTAKGENELSKYIENQKNNFKNNFKYPLLVNLAVGIIGYIAGIATSFIFNLFK
ncbi:MAG: hypothetical protein M3Z87_10985 [Lactobacillus sp.]|nr:hypothetical protein [Staphylococcus epidermidis]MCT6890155.1 hypothetical protein [Lactobacillus sp.]